MDEVHGDLTKKSVPNFSADVRLISPLVALDSIKSNFDIDSLIGFQLVEILGKPYYQIKCKKNNQLQNYLADAVDGKLRPALTEKEAIQVASSHYNGQATVESAVYITTTDADHEYRENPLPAYAVSFKDKAQTTVYVAAELGTVQKFRNAKWRTFDFLWMMHTMNYSDRDKFGNALLRSFSILGLITIASGFWLFFITQKKRF